MTDPEIESTASHSTPDPLPPSQAGRQSPSTHLPSLLNSPATWSWQHSLLIGAILGTIAALVVEMYQERGQLAVHPGDRQQCLRNGQSVGVISRDQLGELGNVAPPIPKHQLHWLPEPYCQFPVTGREGRRVVRDAYPLEFDPQTWLVIRYEEDTYVGYDFNFR